MLGIRTGRPETASEIHCTGCARLEQVLHFSSGVRITGECSRTSTGRYFSIFPQSNRWLRYHYLRYVVRTLNLALLSGSL